MPKSNLKAVDEDDQFSWREINQLAEQFASDLQDAQVDAMPLMLLLEEISTHPSSNVETIVNVLNHHLFSVRAEAGQAETKFLRAARAKFRKGGGA